MWLLFLVLACSKNPAPEHPAGHALDDPELSPCMDACLERSMARAVAYEMLLADCAAMCDKAVEVKGTLGEGPDGDPDLWRHAPDPPE